MSSTPPRLTAASTERMACVVDAADGYVDAGMTPNQALAKAAQDAKLPVTHVPHVVRAFNTGRAVRQLGESDVWTKAASYPTATIEGVQEELGGAPTVKQASATDVSDYAFGPKHKVETPTIQFTVVKEASKPEPVRRDNTISHDYACSVVYGEAADVASRLKPAQYAAVKEAAAYAHPAAAEFFFSELESQNWRVQLLAKQASTTKPDVTVMFDHPVVKAIVKLAEMQGQRVETAEPDVPAGYRKVAVEGTRVWYEKDDAPKVDTFNILPTDPLKFDAVDQSKVAGFAAGFGSGAGTMFNAANKLVASPLTSKALDFSVTEPQPLSEGAVTGDLSRGRDRLQTQDMAQGMLQDPRFAKSDPKVLLDTFHSLRSLAPNAMANPAIAADMVQRRLQTGPLSYFDLDKLVTIEHRLHKMKTGDMSDD